jgi:hypothetical protein
MNTRSSKFIAHYNSSFISRFFTAGIRMRGLLTGLTALLAYLPMQQRANADLIWDITIPLNAVAPWDVDNDFGYEGVDLLRIDYNVQNQSTGGDANNLIQFSVSAGSNQGVYNTTTPGGSWSASIFDDYTSFTGNGSFIAPTFSGTFSIFSTYTNTTTGTANAVARGSGGNLNQPFEPPLEVPIPVIPEPTTLVDTISADDFTNLSISVTFSNVNLQTTTIQAASGLLPADWRPLTSFPSRAGTTNIVIPFAFTNDTLFIRTTTERYP